MVFIIKLMIQSTHKPRRKRMKKLSLLALAAVTLVACGENKPTPEDFSAIEQEIQANPDVVSIVTLGPAGDYVVTVNASETILKIADMKKTVTFLSAENPSAFIEEGKCLLNIIPAKTMEDMNMPENKCNFRLFCGTVEDAAAEVYAVEVCSE